MPIVDREMSCAMQRGGWRPHCYQCGRFIGEGGYYDVIDNEEGYSTCREHASPPAAEGTEKEKGK